MELNDTKQHVLQTPGMHAVPRVPLPKIPSVLLALCARRCTVQLLKSIGVLNLPEWYNAGQEAQKGSFAPFGTPPHKNKSLPLAATAMSTLLVGIYFKFLGAMIILQSSQFASVLRKVLVRPAVSWRRRALV